MPQVEGGSSSKRRRPGPRRRASSNLHQSTVTLVLSGIQLPQLIQFSSLRFQIRIQRQCRTHGGYSATTRRILAAMVNGTPGIAAAAPAGSVSAGTHLVREWNGRTYHVEVIDNGYRFDGKTYPSLTAIAKRITGTHWSGPRFFSLTPKRKA